MKIVSDKWQVVIDWGETWLPLIFFRKIIMNDGHIIYQRKWITKKDWNTAIDMAQNLYDNLNWD